MPVRQKQQAEASLLERVSAIGKRKRQESAVEHGCFHYDGNDDEAGSSDADGLSLEG